MSSSKSMTFLLFFKVLLLIFVTNGNKDTTYSTKEKVALLKFREEVQDLIYLDYQNEDVFLIRWLRATHLDVARAKEMLSKAVHWRKHNNIDTILDEEEQKGLKNVLPISSTAVDRVSRPILVMPFGTWNLRKFALAGKMNLVHRNIAFNLETITSKVRDAARSGKNVSQWFFLVDINGYNLRQHACLSCLTFYSTMVSYYESYYPLTAAHIVIINSLRIFEAVLQLIRPLMSDATRRDFQVLGPNKAEWQPILLKLISPEELTPLFGGTKELNAFSS